MDHRNGPSSPNATWTPTTNERSVFQPLLADLDLAGVLSTADALRTRKVTSVTGLDSPHPAQAIQVACRVRDLHRRRWRGVSEGHRAGCCRDLPHPRWSDRL